MAPRKYLDVLRGALCGALLEPNQPGYAQSLVLDNGRIDLQPSVVVMAANAQDIATTLAFAVEPAVPHPHRMNRFTAWLEVT